MGWRMGGGAWVAAAHRRATRRHLLPSSPVCSSLFVTTASLAAPAMRSLRAARLLAACLCLAGTALAQQAAVVSPRGGAGVGPPLDRPNSSATASPRRTPACSPSWPCRAWASATAGRAWATASAAAAAAGNRHQPHRQLFNLTRCPVHPVCLPP